MSSKLIIQMLEEIKAEISVVRANQNALAKALNHQPKQEVLDLISLPTNNKLIAEMGFEPKGDKIISRTIASILDVTDETKTATMRRLSYINQNREEVVKILLLRNLGYSLYQIIDRYQTKITSSYSQISDVIVCCIRTDKVKVRGGKYVIENDFLDSSKKLEVLK